ncbi:MAG: GNAT family N-acetyltransferase [Pararhodobacter sp.]|nr:GNAT family N-acetyltransferase [Pararhodobacter sp.]
MQAVNESKTGRARHAQGSAAALRAFDPAAIAWVDAGARALASHAEDILAPLRKSEDALQRAGLTLRAWLPDDLPEFRALLDDPQIWAWLPEPYPDPLDEDTARTLITAAGTLPHHVVRAVLSEGKPVGQLRLEWDDGGRNRREAEISYWLGQAFWGAGFGSAMVAGAVARAFGNDPALLRLVAKVHPENQASARLLQKVGFHELAAPPKGRGFADWRWFALRRQHRPQATGG